MNNLGIIIDTIHRAKMAKDAISVPINELRDTEEHMARKIIEGLNDGRADSMDEYCVMNRPAEIDKIEPSTPRSFEEIFAMPHDEYVAYLWQIHGKSQYDYFLTPAKTMVNQKIERRQEGLMLHHISEECGTDIQQLLTIRTAKELPFEIYKASNFVYCDYFEHLLLHIKIALEDLERGRQKLNGIDLAGAKILWRELNKYYGIGKALVGRKYAIELVKDKYKDYVTIMSTLAKLIKDGHPLGQYCMIEELAQDETGYVHVKILKDII